VPSGLNATLAEARGVPSRLNNLLVTSFDVPVAEELHALLGRPMRSPLATSTSSFAIRD